MARKFLGTGWTSPMQFVDGRLQTTSGELCVEQSIWAILETAPGERVMRPEFGCAIHDLVFSTASAEVIGQINSAVYKALAQFEGDAVARPLALALLGQVDLDVAHVGHGAEIVVADEAIEVERGRGAGIGLERDDLWHVLDQGDGGLEDAVGVFDRGALGEVDDHLEVGLVVEGQQLDRDGLGIEQAERADGEDDDDGEEEP